MARMNLRPRSAAEVVALFISTEVRRLMGPRSRLTTEFCSLGRMNNLLNLADTVEEGHDTEGIPAQTAYT